MANGDPKKDNLKQLYDYVSKDTNIGTWDDFSGKMDNSDKRKKFYEVMTKREVKLGPYDKYESALKKKELGGEDIGVVSEKGSLRKTPKGEVSDVFGKNLQIEDIAPDEPKEGILPIDDSKLTTSHKKLIEDYQSLYKSDPRDFNMSEDEILKDLRTHHVDYEPIETGVRFKKMTPKEFETYEQEHPGEAKKQRKEHKDYLKSIELKDTEEKIDEVYHDKVKNEGLSDAGLFLLPESKSDEWISEAWDKQSKEVRAIDRLAKVKSDALHREVDQYTSFEADLKRASEEYGGIEALRDDKELKGQVKNQVLNERLNYGVQELSPNQQELYNLQLKYNDLKKGMGQPMNAGQRTQLGDQLNSIETKIEEHREAMPLLYNPETNEYIDPNDVDPEEKVVAMDYENKVQKEMIKYKNSDLGSLLRSWNQLQSNLRYVEDVLGGEPLIPEDLQPNAPLLSIKEVKTQESQYIETGTALSEIAKPGADIRGEYKEAIKDARSKFDAVNRALLLNQDPSAIDKGFWSLFGEHAIEGFGLNIESDADFIEDFVAGIKDTGGVLTKAQEKAAKDDLGDKVAKGLGDSIAPMVELVATTYLTGGLGSIAAVSRGGALLKGAMMSRWGKSGEFTYNVLKEGLKGTLSFGLASNENLSAIMGLGEGTVQGLIDGLNPSTWIKKSKYAKLFELGMRSLGGMVGETAAEFTGDYLDNLKDTGLNWEFAFEKTFGRTPEDFNDKLVTTAIISLMFSATSNTSKLTYEWSRKQIEQSDSPHKEEYLEQLDQLEVDSNYKKEKAQVKEGEVEPVTKEVVAKAEKAPVKGEVTPSEVVEEKVTEVAPGEVEVGKAVEVEGEPVAKTEEVKEVSEVEKSSTDLNEKAKSLGYNSVQQFNAQKALDEDLTKEESQLLEDYGAHQSNVKSQTDVDVIDSMSESDFNTWEKANDVSRDDTGNIVNEEDIQLAAKRIDLLQGKESKSVIKKGDKELQDLKNSKKIEDWTIDSWEKQSSEILTQKEIDIKNEEGKSFNVALNKALEAIEVKKTEVKPTREPKVPSKPTTKKPKGMAAARKSPEAAQYQEAKEQLAYGAITQDTDRIPPSPISKEKLEPGEKVRPITESLSDLSKGINKIISYAKPPGRRAAGTYHPRSSVIKIKTANDIDTVAHEVGHALDDQYGILKDIPEESITSIDKELKPFVKYGSPAPKSLSKKKKIEYRRAEGVAEWMRAYMVNPEAAKEKAPQMYEWFKKMVPKGTIAVLDKFGRDFRVFAGSSAHEMIGQQVKFEYTAKKNPIAQLFRRGNTLDEKKFEITYADKLATNWTNRMNAFEKAFEFAVGVKGITELMPEKDSRVLARLYLGINDKLGDMLKNGLVDTRNERVLDKKTGEPMTLHWLLGSLDNSSLESLKQEQQEVITAMIAERTLELPVKFFVEKVEKDLAADKLPPDAVIERYIDLKGFTEKEIDVIDQTIERLKEGFVEPEKISKYDQKSPVTGIGAGIFSEGSVARKRLKDLEEMSVRNPDKYKRITESARRYRVFSDQTLKYMVDKGRLAKDQYDKIKETNSQYVALLRVMESEPNQEIEVFARGKGGSLGSVKKPVHKIKGSSRLIENPYASLLDYFYKGTTEADRNDVLTTFREMLMSQRGFYEGTPENLAQVGYEVKQSDKGDKQEIFVDGKAEYWRFDPDVHKAIKNISELTAELPLALTALPSILRWTVTNFPTFGIRNAIRDTQNRLVISGVGGVEGIRNFVGDKADISKFKLSGGGQAGYYISSKENYYELMEKEMKKMSKDKRFILLDPQRLKGKLWDNGYKKFIEGTEQINRVAEWRGAYKDAKKKGMDDYNAQLHAGFQSRDLLDFAVAGHYMRYINKLVPFSNAAIQGLRKTLKTAKIDPKGFAIRWTLYSLVPAIINRVLIRMMDEDEAYQKLPAYQRDLFFNIPIAPNTWLSIPKPFELGVTGSGGERLVDMMFYGNEDAFEGYAGSVARATIPIDEAALAGPYQGIVQVLANYDFFRQKELTPDDARLRAELRNVDGSSNLGKLVQSTFGLHAKKADFLIKSQFSYFGGMALKLSDLGEEETTNEIGLSDIGLFRRTPVYNSLDVQFVLDFAARNDIKRSPEYLNFQRVIADYFNALNDKESEMRGKVVMQYAKDLRFDWEMAEPHILARKIREKEKRDRRK